MKKMALSIICMLVVIGNLFICEKEIDAESFLGISTAPAPIETRIQIFDVTYTVDTTIAYSDGSDNNWAYGNQRKEFSADDDCYVRIGSTAVTNKKKGVDEKIKVVYRFTGVENCKVELTDGIGTELDTQDANVKEFEGTLYPKKKKAAKESIVIFKYIPSGEGSITLEVIYDDNVDPQYDKRNTVYFVKDE